MPLARTLRAREGEAPQTTANGAAEPETEQESSMPPQDWVLVARLGRTRGLKGDVYAEGLAEESRFASLGRVWLRKPDGAWAVAGAPLEVESVRPYKGRLVFHFRGIDKIGAAEPLEHCEVVTPKSARPTLREGEYYLGDLVGCEVFDRSSGEKLGTVVNWQEFGGPVTLEVALSARGRGSGQNPDVVWIPFARAICVEIDPAARRLVVDPPVGLLELNQLAGREPEE